MVIVLGFCTNIASAQLQWDPQEFMGVEEIRTGMVGYGKTVYEGTNIETFDIEVIGVLRKIDFGFDMILIRITSGPVVDRKLQTVSGMSGSPIYINDRMIGAYAYGWNFQQEAIGGVTPIAAMLECSQPGAVTPPLVGSLIPSNKVLRIGEHLITHVNVVATEADGKALQAKSSLTTMVLTPVATPVFMSGISEKAAEPLQRMLHRHSLQAMPGPGEVEGPAPPLEPGSAVSFSLMEGDANLSAVGTVTYVKGNTVLALGHPFLGIGNIDLPMAPAYVHGILSSSESSFKLASPFSRTGRMYSDRGFAVAGTVGEKANTIPVSLYLTDKSRDFTRRYQVEMMNHPDFSPVLLYMYVVYSGALQMADLFEDEGTFFGRMLMKTDKLGDIDLQVVVSPRMSLFDMPFGTFYALTDVLQTNPYEEVKINSIFVDVQYQPGRNYAMIEKATADRPVARPGETVNLTVKVRPFGKPLETHTIPVRVPDNATEPVMLVAVAGGAMWPMLRPYDRPFPQPEQGLKGIVKWLTEEPPTQSLITAKILPSPSYGYRGHMLRDLPAHILDLLRFADTGVMPQSQSEGSQGSGGLPGGQQAMPTAYITSQAIPYVTLGVQVVNIAVETEDRVVQPLNNKSGFSMQLPVLSSSLASGPSAPGEPAEKYSPMNSWAMWMTPLHRARFAQLEACMRLADPQPRAVPALPILINHQSMNTLPLSFSQLDDRQTGPDVTRPTPPGQEIEEDDGEGENGEEDGEEEPPTDDGEEDPPGHMAHPQPGGEVYASLKDLLTKKQPSWGLTSRDDFLRGKHLGTGVTSKGNLVLVPSVRSVYQTTDMVPWRMVTVGDNTYVAGWKSKQIIRLDLEGNSDVFFTRDGAEVEAITALAADAAGNLLFSTWPEQHVVMISPAGKVLNDWQLPGSEVWDLAVTAEGKRYAATGGGMVYLLRDDKQAPLQVACSVPDKHVVTMIANGDGLLLATAPRGKVYRLGKDDVLRSVYEGKGMVTSMAVDAAGNLYVGASPTCQVIRISPDGIQQEIMRGMGRGNRHVLAMRMVGDDLYATTGPAGGIYRIGNPAGQDVEVTPIFVREDQRIGSEEDGVGPESVMVNALTVNRKGELLVAASTPGQVLKLEPRTQGAFLSTVLQTPVVARWGRLDLQTEIAAGQNITVDSRSGHTSVPDTTWSRWSAVAKDWSELTSPPATFAQFRVTFKGTDASPTLTYARLFYQPVNQAPQIRLHSPTAGLYWSGTKQIRWEARDPDEDELVYTVFTSADRGKSWQQIVRITPEKKPDEKPATDEKPSTDAKPATDKQPAADVKPATDAAASPETKKNGKPAANGDAEPANGEAPAATPPVNSTEKPTAEKPAVPKPTDGELKSTSIPWDTKDTPDGSYLIRVVATDKYAKPTAPRSAEIISGLITVDNVPPAVKLPDKIHGWDAVKQFMVTDNLSPILGGKYRIDDGPWTALVADDGIFNRRQELVRMVTPNGDVVLTKGEFKLQIQVLDAAGNLLDKTITILSGEQPTAPAQARINYLPIDVAAGAGDLQLLDVMLRGLQRMP
jgi:hypothetical protein